MNTLSSEKIDYFEPPVAETFTETPYHENLASTALIVGNIAIRLASVERKPRYTDEHRENDSEHSQMLAMVATELAAKLYPGKLDIGLVALMAMAHELFEIKTGDVATFHFNADDMAAKHAAEAAMLEEFLEELPPYMAYLFKQYIAQETPEARFVNAVDKLTPVIVDILGSGKKVMAEDYDVHTSQQLRASHKKLHGRIADSYGEFPEIVSAHGLMCNLFSLEFEATPQRSA